MKTNEFDQIISSVHLSSHEGEIIGNSRNGRPIQAFRFGIGDFAVSLIGGCHADEPVGPMFLRHFAAYLSRLQVNHPLLTHYQWWILPHANPDGEENNLKWTNSYKPTFCLSEYLSSVVRELPGDDIEFGFPLDENDRGARPENKAIAAWWQKAETPFQLHVSLHGLTFGKGPWFLLDTSWISRSRSLIDKCTQMTNDMGYSLHDVDRSGEKGFTKIATGFSARPDSRSLKEYFFERGEKTMAAKVRPTSMETIRKLFGDVLTLVSEIPLFIVPSSIENRKSSLFNFDEWKKRFESWQREKNSSKIMEEAKKADVTPMLIRDQMLIQYFFIMNGIELVESFQEVTA